MDKRKLARIEKPEDLSIVCFLWDEGQYVNGRGKEYVNKLFRMVSRNTSLPFQFFCFTDVSKNDLDKGIILQNIKRVDYEWNGKKAVYPILWRKNLKKAAAYSLQNDLTGRVIMFDLDIVIIKNIDNILKYNGFFAACIPDLNGSVVGFSAHNKELAEKLFHPLCRNYDNISQRTRGRERRWYQEKLKPQEDTRVDLWQDLFFEEIVSYKRNGFSERAKIVYFHGKPKPHQMNIGWVKDNWI